MARADTLCGTPQCQGMASRTLAAVPYLPLPGLGLVAWAAPQDPLTRYHARQGGLLVALLYVALLLVGLLAGALPTTLSPMVASLLGAPVLLLGILGILWGAWGAMQGRFVRVRPVWDLCSKIWP